MPKLRLIGLTLLALSATAVSHAEETRYVSDELNTWVRSGPGDHYRLVGTVNAGEEVTLLQTDANTNYAQVKDSSGRTAWIPLKQLSTEPSLRSRVPDLENQVKTLTDKLTNIDNTWNQRTAEMQQKVAQSDSVINGLKEENQKLKNELIVAQKKVDAASVQLDDKQRTIIMQWFMYGGGVLGRQLRTVGPVDLVAVGTAAPDPKPQTQRSLDELNRLLRCTVLLLGIVYLTKG